MEDSTLCMLDPFLTVLTLFCFCLLFFFFFFFFLVREVLIKKLLNKNVHRGTDYHTTVIDCMKSNYGK